MLNYFLVFDPDKDYQSGDRLESPNNTDKLLLSIEGIQLYRAAQHSWSKDVIEKVLQTSLRMVRHADLLFSLYIS